MELTVVQKIELRKEALRAAKDCNPTIITSNSGLGLQQTVHVTVDKMLSYASKIYEWLIKE